MEYGDGVMRVTCMDRANCEGGKSEMLSILRRQKGTDGK